MYAEYEKELSVPAWRPHRMIEKETARMRHELIVSMILGFIIDLIVGDPHGLIHPVQIIGWFITKIKEGLQRLLYGCSYEEAVSQGLPRKKTESSSPDMC